MPQTFKKIAGRVLLGLLLVFVGLLIYTWLHYSPAGETYPAAQTAHIDIPLRLRNWDEHNATRTRNGGNPYIFEVKTQEAGALVYYGASHTQDPDHPQLADITTRWKAFNPTVGLYEGRSRGFFYGDLIEPFAGLPEPALVHKLARAQDVPLYTLEPGYADEVAALLTQYTPKQVALYFFLRVYTSEAGGNANESLARDLLHKRTDVEGLRGSLVTLTDVDALWQNDFSDQVDWRVLQGEPGYLAEISDASRQVRGDHMMRMIIDLVNKGERVFAVVGSGHVIRQEWNLRSTFNMEPAYDQPAEF